MCNSRLDVLKYLGQLHPDLLGCFLAIFASYEWTERPLIYLTIMHPPAMRLASCRSTGDQGPASHLGRACEPYSVHDLECKIALSAKLCPTKAWVQVVEDNTGAVQLGSNFADDEDLE